MASTSTSSPQLTDLETELTSAREILYSSPYVETRLPVGVGFITCQTRSVKHFPETTLPILARHRVTAVYLFAQDPEQIIDGSEKPELAHRFIIRHVHSAGIKAIVQVGTVVAAKEAVENGADALVAQGLDAGGHQFAANASVISLVPELRALLNTQYVGRNIGLLAAGGIVNGMGVAAALCLGECSIETGDRYITISNQ